MTPPFEIEVEALGKLKVYKATEVRTNLTEVIKDDQLVLINLHGTPAKLIVDYNSLIDFIKKNNLEKLWKKHFKV